MMAKHEMFEAPSMKEINKMPKRLKAISFFAGCGGSSVGYKLATYDVLYANEFVPIAAECYGLNAGTTKVDTRDIRKVNAKKLMAQLGLQEGELDLLDGSPPCKAFSNAGEREKMWGKEVLYSEGIKQRVDDLFDEYIRMVKVFRPKTFVAENVPGLAASNAQGYLIEIINNLSDLGYVVDARILDTAQLGLPMVRRRLIIIGVRKDLFKKLKLTRVPYPTPQKHIFTVREALPHVMSIRVPHAKTRHFVSADQPQPTILASDGHHKSMTKQFSSGGYVEDDQGEKRRYTIAELKILFGFPKDFKLVGRFAQQWERIGRSHSPASSYWIGRALAQQVLLPLKRKKS